MTIIWDTKVNHKAKLIHNFTPKCASSGITQWLYSLDTNWEWYPRLNRFCDPDTIPKGYTVFSTVRDPIAWIISGYRMFKEKHNLSISFEEHCKIIANSDSIPKKMKKEYYWQYAKQDIANYHWHCVLLPEHHLIKGQVVFKIEEHTKIIKWMKNYFPHASDENFPNGWNNTKYDPDISFSPIVKKCIKKKTKKYAKKFGYELNFSPAYITKGWGLTFPNNKWT
tara:strand:+ start:3352 stop:4023 length:672 start_codon:yes stop_codon:yes gene_type:complete